MMIQPEKCLQLYLAVKVHFSNEKYDAVACNAHVKNASKADLEQRRDHKMISSLARKFTSSQHAASFFVANTAYNNAYPFDDEELSFSLLSKWQRNRQSLTKIFKDDLAHLSDLGVSFESLISTNVENGNVPLLFTQFINGKITIETMSIINTLCGVVDGWKKEFPLWAPEILRIRKLASFIKIDREKYESIFINFRNELDNHAKV